MESLQARRDSPLWRRVIERPYTAIDLLVLGGLVALVVSVVY
jgi:hypothetical protein